LNDCQQECQNISSLEEQNLNTNIYPNPSSNVFNLEFYSEKRNIELIVTTVLGNEVYYKKINAIGHYNAPIDLSNYSKGIYNLSIKTEDTISNYKLILQ
jgi:hypothetical protein